MSLETKLMFEAQVVDMVVEPKHELSRLRSLRTRTCT